jgi:RNA polymerase sigma-70 factor (ECF subfamily)
MAGDSDRVLIRQIRSGDAGAWDGLIERYEGRLLAFAERRLRDRAAAEDVVQETFIGFLNSLPNFDENRDLQSYLFSIAAHKLTDQLRRTGRHPLQNLPDGQEFFEKQMDSQTGVSSVARGQERRALEADAVAQALAGIIDEWKSAGEYQRLKILELLLVKGWANKDVAAFLGVKEQQVANVRFAAVRRLHDRLRGAGLSPDVFPGLRGEP